MKGLESWFKARSERSGKSFAAWLTPALIMALLAGISDASVGSVGSDGSAQVVANAADISAGYNVKFQEAIRVFREKGVVTPEQYRALDAAAKARAFTVGGMTDRYALDAIKESLQQAIETGRMPNQWLTGLEDQFKSLGLSGVGGDAAHMRLVFRENASQAYSAGHHIQMQQVKKQRPYWQRISVGDDHVRPEHQMLDGVIKPADDQFWTGNYPPYLGGKYQYGCRCIVVSLSREEMDEEGLAVTGPVTPLEPSSGHELDPARAFPGLEGLL